MKIEQHHIVLQTEYQASETVLTKDGEKWQTSLLEGMQLQKVDTGNLQESLKEMLERLRRELIHELLGVLNPMRRNHNSSQAFSNQLTLSDEKKQEFKRFGIPVKTVTFLQERKTSECVKANMIGCVRTEDGREIALDVKLGMSQSFYSKVETTQAVLTDPLVVNFTGRLPGLEEACFAFDIDCDGESDQISRLTEGSGFLALDENDNGTIDDGSELFGTESGDGFADLAEYDEDGNRWIDESDDIFDKLRIWTTDGETSQLVALGQAGMGAIYLGSVASEFTYRSDTGESLGALRSTGMFLYENGNAGNVSQIDLAKRQPSDDEEGLKKALQTLEV